MRRDLVRSLRGARLSAPDRLTGTVLVAFSDAGVFRMRAVVVGSVAFQTYPALLGVGIPANLARTADLDIAQAHLIAVMVEDEITRTPKDLLKKVDSNIVGIPTPRWKACVSSATHSDPEPRSV
ncbi:GSU2403 family nucleotidyltransferase fold protein [Nisaea sediminum]|uniref:GSU2403 family nucleotidyltransferase fold protein n=1 Tax=Nisaea sediminum TaxID=2775867 RepID=UPI00186888D9